MFVAIRERLEKDEDGFTLIELLVVVIIIGILAAIAIPTFLRQRERGWEAAAQSELRNLAIAQESHYTISSPNTYSTVEADFTAQGFNPSTAVNRNYISGDGTAYCMAAQHGSGGNVYTLSSTGGAPVRQADAVTLAAAAC